MQALKGELNGLGITLDKDPNGEWIMSSKLRNTYYGQTLEDIEKKWSIKAKLRLVNFFEKKCATKGYMENECLFIPFDALDREIQLGNLIKAGNRPYIVVGSVEDGINLNCIRLRYEGGYMERTKKQIKECLTKGDSLSSNLPQTKLQYLGRDLTFVKIQEKNLNFGELSMLKLFLKDPWFKQLYKP